MVQGYRVADERENARGKGGRVRGREGRNVDRDNRIGNERVRSELATERERGGESVGNFKKGEMYRIEWTELSNKTGGANRINGISIY